MDNNRDKKQATEKRDGSKDDEEESEAKNMQQGGVAPTSSAAERARESSDDTEEDDDERLHTVSSVKEIKHAMVLITLEEGTHTTATETESLESVDKLEKHVSFGEIIDVLAMPAPSTSKVVENVREYVKEIEGRLDYAESVLPDFSTSPQPSAAKILEPVKAELTLETIKDASELSYTSKQSEESFSQLSEVERIAHDEVERIVAENEQVTRPDFRQVERENQEIAERFKQIMEMFDSFTKNLESLEMPAIRSTEEVSERVVQPLRRRLSFKGLCSTDIGSADGASAGAASSGSYNELYLEVQGERKKETDFTAKREIPGTQNFAPSSSGYTQKAEAALDPMYRDIATTVSGLELHNVLPTPNSSKYRQEERVAQNLSTIGCQTVDDFYTLQASTSASTCFSNFHTTPKDYSLTDDDDDVVNALIIDSITDATTSSAAAAVSTSFTDTTETSNITVVQPRTKIHGTTDQSAALVKIREPPTIIDLTPDDTSAPRVTSIITDTSDAPCERTYHTIHIEANSSPSSSEMRRPPLCSRLWNVITDFCAAVCLCLQVNKDCLFCLGFFIAFIVSASFLTAFFYRTLTINPQLVQTSTQSSGFTHQALYSTPIE